MTDVITALQDDFKLFLQALWEQLDLPSPTRAQYSIADYLQNGPKRLQIQAFRGVGKSWITGAFVLWTLFKDMQTKNPEFPQVSFDKLPAEMKQRFFKQNVNTIAVKGNVMKDISIKKAMKSVKNWNNHIADTFGWSPQSLWITPKEIEEITKELMEKVQTTQPIPGVV